MILSSIELDDDFYYNIKYTAAEYDYKMTLKEFIPIILELGLEEFKKQNKLDIK